MKATVFNQQGKKLEDLVLSDAVFGIKPNKEILLQYLRVFRSNQRQGTQSTKNRGEVAGSGVKPWRQKGTGRARVGSKRTPLWRHGGISHGPKPRSWALSLPQKMRSLAIKSALSTKFLQKSANILDKIVLQSIKTKELTALLLCLKLRGKTLLVLDKNDLSIRKSCSNISYLRTALASNLNAFDLLCCKNVVFLKEAVLALQDKYETK